MPQENGNRTDTRWVKIHSDTDTQKASRSIHGLKATYIPGPNERQYFQWAACTHEADILEHADHPCDLTERAGPLWRLDADNAGVGTASCGPGTRPEWQVECRERDFAFVLEPLV